MTIPHQTLIFTSTRKNERETYGCASENTVHWNSKAQGNEDPDETGVTGLLSDAGYSGFNNEM
jgi:hypothetical protein